MKKTPLAILSVFVLVFLTTLLMACGSHAAESNGVDLSGSGNVVEGTAVQTGTMNQQAQKELPFNPQEVELGAVANPTTSGDTCDSDPRYISVTFQWVPSGKGEQWLDLSLFPNDFAPGTFVGIGPFSPKIGQVTWDGLMPSRTHYFRVNTLTASGWETSDTRTFATDACVNGKVAFVTDQDLQVLGQSFVNAIDNSGVSGNFDACATDLQNGQTTCANGVRQ